MILLPKSLANITVATDTKPMMTASTLFMIVVCLSDIFGLQGRIKSSIITAADALRMELSVLKNIENILQYCTLLSKCLPKCVQVHFECCIRSFWNQIALMHLHCDLL